ncbi:SGNH/GDSL hydrolase family protein [Sediminicola sp. 1XM1-17]|uniref:SGNH/GDSL hydrolase family protein n=1 Tax=Sediminicola sp. 1XM1-17 TaxID=3127702 RepID=UPI003077BDC1
MRTIKYILFASVLLGFASCNTEEDFNMVEVAEEVPALTAGSADFSNYVAIGASFSAGYTDGALFKAGQQNSFPALLAQQFALAGGGSFNQPLMNDNFGGLLLGGTQIADNRLVFNGKAPVRLQAFVGPVMPTTDILINNPTGPFNNMGVPGAKSFHLVANGYGNVAGVPLGRANPYYARMATSATSSMLADALVQGPTFFTLSEIGGGNDVLAYATSGGVGVDQKGNLDPTTYGSNDITDPNVFAQVMTTAVAGLTANGAKGVIANVPYITNLPYFTTVPFKPLSPTNPSFGPQIPTLNGVFGQLNLVFDFLQVPDRKIVFSQTAASAVVVKDESLTNLSAQITGVLNQSPTFPAFVQSFGLPAQAAPVVANLFGVIYGQARQATAEDLLVLPSSSVIGTVNTSSVAFLMSQGLSQALAGQFSVEGVSLPLEDKWVLTPEEQTLVLNATDAYNATLRAIADANGLAFVDFKAILQQAASTGIKDGNFTLNTKLVTGGLVSLDGIHLTARGYAVMANKFLEAIDATYGSNFIEAKAKVSVGSYPTNYSPALQ